MNFLNAFEVNTHQALTRCAITNNCNNGRAENLINFIVHAKLSGIDYSNEDYEGYLEKYIDYANDGLGFRDWNINVNPDYLGMIEAGSVLEDAVYPVHDNSGDGRFNNHFYAVQFNSYQECNGFISSTFGLKAYMRTTHTLCYGYARRTDNIDWVFNDSVNLYWKGYRKNDYGLSDAFEYYLKSFEGTQAERRKYQAKLFVSLGHIVHMLQDLHSPAHCRGNSHPKGDYLEIYGRYNGGFNLRNGVFNRANNPKIIQAIASYGKASIILANNHYYTYEDFFKKEAQWVGNNFASESHLGFEKINKTTGSGLKVDNLFDSSSLFDGKNRHPSKSETYEGSKISGFSNWAYIYTEGNNESAIVNGYIPPSHRTIGLVKHGLLFDSYHMIAPRYTWKNGGLQQIGLNQKPLEDTAVNVMPRAIAATQAFINFFFRGQIDVNIDSEGKMTIKNDAKANVLTSSSLATLKAGGIFHMYYNHYGENIHFHSRKLTHDVTIGKSITIDLGKERFKNMSQGTKITVIFEGNIGTLMGGWDSYNTGMKGLSVDVANLPYIEQDPEPSPEPSPEPTPDNATYKYVVTTVDHTKSLPYRHGEYGQISYNVDIYRNDILERTDRLSNLLNVSWWNGGAHFGDSEKHHFDIWCQGYGGLCSYLRLHVPTDDNTPYEDYQIDWTIWNYGLEEYSVSLFLYNIRTQIGKYYAMFRLGHRSANLKSVDVRSAHTENNNGTVMLKGAKIQFDEESVSDVQHRTIDGMVIDDTGN